VWLIDVGSFLITVVPFGTLVKASRLVMIYSSVTVWDYGYNQNQEGRQDLGSPGLFIQMGSIAEVASTVCSTAVACKRSGG
jgi:hypothetical protein